VCLISSHRLLAFRIPSSVFTPSTHLPTDKPLQTESFFAPSTHLSSDLHLLSLSRICPDIWSIRPWFLPRHIWFWSGLGLVEIGSTDGEDNAKVKTV
jgi:hypothetical protein